jgi:hypothetical protein
MRSKRKSDLELEMLKTELELKKAEVALKEKEISDSGHEKKRSGLSGAHAMIICAFVALMGTLAAAYFQDQNSVKQKEIEQEAALIQKNIVPGDPVQSRKNLQFLLDFGLITHKKEALKVLLEDSAYRFKLKLSNEAQADKSEIEAVFQQISDRIGLARNFQLESCPDVEYCNAFEVDGVRVVRYNPSFVKDMRRKTGSTWSAVFLLAHEAGHHYLGQNINFHNDTTKNYAISRKYELQANEFAGFVLARLGATLGETACITRALCEGDETTHYPTKAQHLSSIKTGWEKGVKN